MINRIKFFIIGFIANISILNIAYSQTIYDSVVICSDDLSKVRMNNKWGVIDKKGKIYIPVMYDSIGVVNEITIKADLLKVKKEDQWGYVGKHNKIKIPLEYEYLQDVTYERQWLIRAKKDGKYGLLNTKGDILKNFIYDNPVGWEHR